MRKIISWLVFFIILAIGIFFWWRYFYVYGDGVKAGTLNFVVYKGMMFKTYEGRMIQTGYKSNVPGSVQSNEFDFSVENKAIAERLMLAGGKTVELHYKEYFGALPWRGVSRYIVDSIISITEVPPGQLPSPY